jgi:hypothetical protein
MGITSASGALLLGLTLALTNTFTLFLLITAILTAVGALLLLLLKNVKPYVEEQSAAPSV